MKIDLRNPHSSGVPKEQVLLCSFPLEFNSSSVLVSLLPDLVTPQRKAGVGGRSWGTVTPRSRCGGAEGVGPGGQKGLERAEIRPATSEFLLLLDCLGGTTYAELPPHILKEGGNKSQLDGAPRAAMAKPKAALGPGASRGKSQCSGVEP